MTLTNSHSYIKMFWNSIFPFDKGFFLIPFWFLWYVCLQVSVWVCTCKCWCPQRPEELGCLVTGLIGGCEHLSWVPGNDLWSPARAAWLLIAEPSSFQFPSLLFQMGFLLCRSGWLSPCSKTTFLLACYEIVWVRFRLSFFLTTYYFSFMCISVLPGHLCDIGTCTLVLNFRQSWDAMCGVGIVLNCWGISPGQIMIPNITTI